jgi:hypothetical protein
MTEFETILTEEWQKGDKSIHEGARKIYNTITSAINENRGAIIGRHGTIELTVLLTHKHHTVIYPDQLKVLERNAGVFPTSMTYIYDWIRDYKYAAADSDAMAVGWYPPLAIPELQYLQFQAPDVIKLPLRSLEPYYLKACDSWTRALEGQHVAVVSSFTQSIEKQLQRINHIWTGDRQGILSDTIKWSFIRSYYSPSLGQGKCEWSESIKNWKQAVDVMEKEVIESGAKICLIGCGGLAMPLALRLKDHGIISIVLGGAIQILFGIKGKRWETHGVISKFFNDAWIFPDKDEIPGGSNNIEGGCYW